MEGRAMKRATIRSKDAEEFIKQYTFEISKKDTVEIIDDKLMLINKAPAFFKYAGQWIPTLKLVAQKQILKTIVVDMGAIKFVINGADIMRPGILDIPQDLQKDECVCIVDANNKKPIAVGLALLDGKAMQETKTGKVIKNIHYVGDEIWKS